MHQTEKAPPKDFIYAKGAKGSSIKLLIKAKALKGTKTLIRLCDRD